MPDASLLHPPVLAIAADPCLTAGHELFRNQVRRFVDTGVKPHAEAWKEAGSAPREVSMVKVLRGELVKVMCSCQQFHGGMAICGTRHRRGRCGGAAGGGGRAAAGIAPDHPACRAPAGYTIPTRPYIGSAGRSSSRAMEP